MTVAAEAATLLAWGERSERGWDAVPFCVRTVARRRVVALVLVDLERAPSSASPALASWLLLGLC